VIKDQLDANVAFVSADNGGINDNGTVRWIIKDVPAGAEGKVTLTVKVIEGALKSKGGPDKVVNGGETATVQIGNDDIYTLEIVENPVKEKSAGTTETSDKTSNKTSDKTPNKTSNTTAVKTGDETALLTLFLMMSIAAAGVVAVLYKKRKRR
jgi:LPXTG-motif cell wall-anchored protein